MKNVICIVVLVLGASFSSFSQEAMEYATVSTNSVNYKKKIKIFYADKTEELEITEQKYVTVRDLMGVLNELSLNGWRVHSTNLTTYGVNYLMERPRK